MPEFGVEIDPSSFKLANPLAQIWWCETLFFTLFLGEMLLLLVSQYFKVRFLCYHMKARVTCTVNEKTSTFTLYQLREGKLFCFFR